MRELTSVLWRCWLGGRKGIWPVKNMGGWWRWALISLNGVAPSQMGSVSATVNRPLHHKVQKFSSGTGSPGWSQKKGRKTVVVGLPDGPRWSGSPAVKCFWSTVRPKNGPCCVSWPWKTEQKTECWGFTYGCIARYFIGGMHHSASSPELTTMTKVTNQPASRFLLFLFPR